MINNILIIVAVLLAAAAFVLALYNHYLISENIETFKKDIKHLELRFNNFADARMVERKELRDAGKV